MPRLVNPADTRLFCGVLERFVDAGEIVEISHVEARALELRGTVFVLLPDATEPKRVNASADGETTAVPKREVKRRAGGKQVETTGKPTAETRKG